MCHSSEYGNARMRVECSLYDCGGYGNHTKVGISTFVDSSLREVGHDTERDTSESVMADGTGFAEWCDSQISRMYSNAERVISLSEKKY